MLQHSDGYVASDSHSVIFKLTFESASLECISFFLSSYLLALFSGGRTGESDRDNDSAFSSLILNHGENGTQWTKNC